jgi:hypothetical protein
MKHNFATLRAFIEHNADLLAQTSHIDHSNKLQLTQHPTKITPYTTLFFLLTAEETYKAFGTTSMSTFINQNIKATEPALLQMIKELRPQHHHTKLCNSKHLLQHHIADTLLIITRDIISTPLDKTDQTYIQRIESIAMSMKNIDVTLKPIKSASNKLAGHSSNTMNRSTEINLFKKKKQNIHCLYKTGALLSAAGAIYWKVSFLLAVSMPPIGITIFAIGCTLLAITALCHATEIIKHHQKNHQQSIVCA